VPPPSHRPPPPPPKRPSRLPLLLLLAMVALGWRLGGTPLLDPDEGRNAEIAREMVISRDYLVPHLGGLPYLDKPIVYFAAAALAMDVLGPTETAARLPAFLATLGLIALVTWFARRRWGTTAGWLAGVAVATMPMVMAYARATIFDSTLALCITAAILCFAEDLPIAAWAAIGVGTLTKGPIAIAVPLCAVIPWALITGQSWRRFFSWKAIAVFGIVTLPWFIAVSLQLPEFPRYVFVRETFQRVTTPGFHRTAPLWYYLPIIPVAAFPWIVPALGRLGAGRWRWAWLARRENLNAAEPWLLFCWIAGPLLFLTINQSKLPQYVLPLMPALALAAARALVRETIGTPSRIAAACLATLGAVFVSLQLWLPVPPATMNLTPAERAAIPGTALAIGASLLAAAAVLLWAARRTRRDVAALAYALPVIVIPFCSRSLLEAVGADRSARALAAAVQPARASVLGVGAYPPSLPFYLGGTVAVATATARELTSNYIADYQEKYRAVPGSPLLPADAWKTRLAGCPAPTVFLARAGDRDTRAALAGLPLIFADAHYAAYGPCHPRAPAPPPPSPGETRGSGG